MTERPRQIDEMAVELVCWHSWFDGPTQGLARWQGRVHWFAYLDTWDEGGADWGYDYVLHELSEESLREAVEWFREKERWYCNPELMALRRDVADAELRARLIVERGLSLRDWDGPTLAGEPVAWFSHRHNRAWYGVNTKDRWRLPEDWPARPPF